MTTTQLDYFLAAADTLNFTVAAERLYTSQSSLSRQIALLEQELGAKLFDRHNNVLQLTTAGALFREQAESLAAQFRKAVGEIREFESSAGQKLHIGLIEDQRVCPVLFQAIRDFIRLHQGISVEVSRGTLIDLSEKLRLGALDICQLPLYDVGSPSQYKTLPLLKEPLCFTVGQSLLALSQDSITAADIPRLLENIPLVMTTPKMYPDSIQPYLPNLAPASANQILYVAELSSIPLYITSGFAATLTNKNNLISSAPMIQMIPVRDITPVTQGCVWLQSTKDPLLLELISLLEKYL